MTKYGLLIDFEYCCGCHTCEVACQKEHHYDVGQFGIKLSQTGPFKVEGTKKTVFDFVPIPTDLCDLCAERTAKGKLPTCVHHCQTGCMSYGTVQELADKASESRKQALFIP